MADIDRIKAAITAIPDFPQPGILFRDIFPIFRDPVLVEALVTHLVHRITSTYKKVDVVVGLDARGFLFGPIIALRIGASFVPVRKRGKLPGKCNSVTYRKEYGEDVFEMQEGAMHSGSTVVVVDDLLATGGTMKAACDLIRQTGGEVLECMCVIELADLGGRAVVPAPVYSMIEY